MVDVEAAPEEALWRVAVVGALRDLGPDELDRCDGSPERLLVAIEQAVERNDLAWPS